MWSLATGVLLVPLMSVGAIADTSADGDQTVHVKESRGIGHIRTTDEGMVNSESPIDRSMTKAEHEAARGPGCSSLVETDHAPFETEDEHKAFHGISTDIDHTNDPAFSTQAEHKMFHSLPCGSGDPDELDHGVEADEGTTTHEDHNSGHENAESSRPGDSTEDPSTDDGPNDSAELKEQPLGHTDDSSAGDTTDRSKRDQENSQDRTN